MNMFKCFDPPPGSFVCAQDCFCLFRWPVLIVAFQNFKDFAKSLQFIDWFADSLLTQGGLGIPRVDDRNSAHQKGSSGLGSLSLRVICSGSPRRDVRSSSYSFPKDWSAVS